MSVGQKFLIDGHGLVHNSSVAILNAGDRWYYFVLLTLQRLGMPKGDRLGMERLLGHKFGVFDAEELERIKARLVAARLISEDWTPTKHNWTRAQRVSSRLIRDRIFERDGYRCRYCGDHRDDDGVDLEVDHVVPISRGGSNEDDNLATACRDCNQSKRGRTVEEWHPE